MRKFTERYKLTALSLREIREGMKAATKRLADQDVKVDGHIIAQANTINIAVLYYLKHSEADQDKIGIDLAPELQRHKESPVPLPIKPLLSRGPGRKRAANPVNQVIVHSDTLSNDRVPTDNGAPKRGR